MLARLNITARLALLLAFNILALTFDRVENLILLTLLSFAIWCSTRPSLDRIKFTLAVVLPVTWSVTLMQGLFYRAEPKTVLLVIASPDTPVIGWLTGGLYLYYQGLIYGLVQSLRFTSVILLGLAIAWSTTESEVIRVFRRYLPNQKLTVALSVAVRFLDVVATEVRTVWLNMQLTMPRKNILSLIVHMVVPLIAQAIRRSYTLTLALLSRGFQVRGRVRTEYGKLTLADKLVIVLSLGVATVLALLKILTVLFLYDVLYVPELGHVYRWVLENL